jgi:carboxyl-terminal processing protease
MPDERNLNSGNIEINDNKASFKRGFFVYALIVGIVIGFAVGIFWGKKNGEVRIVSTGESTEFGNLIGKDGEVPKYLSGDVDFKIFWDTWNIIQEKYVDRPAPEPLLFYGALDGMVRSLDDPFSSFMEPQYANDFSEELQGRFEGIGAEIGIRNDVLTVISPLSGSPAEKSGLMARDLILEIDGEDTEDMSLSEAIVKIRGEKGTVVKLGVYRARSEEFLDIDITRDTINIVSVELKMFESSDYGFLNDKKIAYIKVSHFNADTAERFTKAVQDILLANPDGIILDLRGNPGGFLDTAVDMADYWISEDKTIVIEQKAGDEREIFLATNGAELAEFKTVVLVNAGSASGSEIVAGALQDHQIAELIGETTFGKGSVQQLMDLSDGSAIKITVARWLTPNGTTIDMEGIEPNIEVERTIEDYNNFLDPQLDRAVEYFDN